MRPAPGEVLHFSEDPTITRFEPHVAATASSTDPYVWAVDEDRCPDFWFPRNCPRALVWTLPSSSEEDAARVFGPGGGRRLHAIEYAWMARFLSVRLWAYRLPAATFVPAGDPPSAMVSTIGVSPLGPPVAVGNLLDLHAGAGIQLRVLPNLWEFWDGVVGSTLGYSGWRLRNAAPRPGDGATTLGAVGE